MKSAVWMLPVVVLVSVVPGTAFGDLGEGYVRMALVYPAEEIKKAIHAIEESGILKA